MCEENLFEAFRLSVFLCEENYMKHLDCMCFCARRTEHQYVDCLWQGLQVRLRNLAIKKPVVNRKVLHEFKLVSAIAEEEIIIKKDRN